MIILIIEIIIVYIMSCVIHEIGHSEMSSYLGDNTAKYQGRSSLNPFRHLTISGFRKVPTRLLNEKQLIIVNAAGVLTNLLLVLLAVLFLMVKDLQILHIVIWVNGILFIVNSIPMRFEGATTDGYKIYKYLFP